MSLQIIDPISPRYTALKENETVVVNVRDAKFEMLTVFRHPKNPSLGKKMLPIGPKILIEVADAEQLREGEDATFINWGNLKICKINRWVKVVTKHFACLLFHL